MMACAIACAMACNQRASKQQPAGSGAGTGAAAALDAAAAPPPAALDASLADGTLQLVGIDVLTAPAVFQQRAAAAGPKPMEPLVAAVKDAVRTVDAAKAGALGDTVVVWIAVRPGKQTRAWVACPGKPPVDAATDAARADVAGRMTIAPAPEVSGPVAFTVTFDRSGVRPRSHDIPVPPELARVQAGAPGAATPEQLIERAWKP
jgi:hypothetical protein